MSGMFTHPKRITLNLVMNDEPFDRFMVTESSWQNFLQAQYEKCLTPEFKSQYSQRPEASTHGHARPV
jgi:hypothetical protein